MNIAILGNSIPNAKTDALARSLARELSLPKKTKEHTHQPRPGYRLVTTGSLTGVPAAVREGALEAEYRHVSVHFVESLHPDVAAQCGPEHGIYPCLHLSFADRANFASSCGVVIVLDLNRANVGTVLTLLHNQRKDTAELLNKRPPLCKLLFWKRIFHLHENRLCLAEVVRHFGRTTDAEDMANIVLFSTVEEALQHIRAFDQLILDVAPIR